jgi:hypothetical protein
MEKNITRQQLFYRGPIKNITRQQLFCRGIKRETRHKNDTATKLNREREKRRGSSTNSGSTGKLPQKSGIAENQRKCRGHKNIDGIRRVEAINTAEGPATERGTRYRQMKEKFRNRAK